jgi:hypothetical protein
MKNTVTHLTAGLESESTYTKQGPDIQVVGCAQTGAHATRWSIILLSLTYYQETPRQKKNVLKTSFGCLKTSCELFEHLNFLNMLKKFAKCFQNLKHPFEK